MQPAGIDAVWSEGEVQVAIGELSDADVLRLQQIARGLARGCGLAPDELLSEAIARLLEGIRKVSRTQPFLVVLRSTMRSIAWDNRKLHDNSRVDSGDNAMLDSFEDNRKSPEEELAGKELRNSVLALFDEDIVNQTICEGWIFDQMNEKELLALTGLNTTDLASRKRAISRRLGRSDIGAHLR